MVLRSASRRLAAQVIQQALEQRLPGDEAADQVLFLEYPGVVEGDRERRTRFLLMQDLLFMHGHPPEGPAASANIRRATATGRSIACFPPPDTRRSAICPAGSAACLPALQGRRSCGPGPG